MSDQPLVSILVPCFNAEKWIRQCVQSALDQTWPNKEVLVVDDGSTDKSVDVLRTFGDKIQVATGPNCGGNAARNRLIAMSRGSWLQFLDSDDYLLPEKVSGQMNFALAHPEFDLVYSRFILRDEKSGQERPAIIADRDDPVSSYLSWQAFCTHSMLLRRSTLTAIDGWNEAQMVCQEHELVLRLFVAGAKPGFFDQSLAVYRHHGTNSVSQRSPENTVRRRMELTDRLSDHLIATGQMTPQRAAAVAKSRLESARSMYRWNRPFAHELMKKALADRSIPVTPASPFGYRLALRIFGFEAAERIAKLKRHFFQSPGDQEAQAGA